MQDYKKLKVWEKAHQLTLLTYQITTGYPKEETYAFTQQMRRAASSIPMNIAEGCGRNSNMDTAHFLNIAIGPTNEIDYQYLLSKDMLYITTKEYETIEPLIGEIRAMLIALVTRIRNHTHNSKLITQNS